MCKRNDASNDALLSVFMERYNLNLLSVPREKADVGDLYVHDGKRAGSPGHVSGALAKPFAMPSVVRDEALAGLSGTASNSVSAAVGLGLLGAFLSGLGAAIPIGDVGAKWSRKGTGNVRFRMEGAVRDSVDPLALANALIGNTLRADHPLVGPGSRFYLVAGVARCHSLTVAFENDRGQTIDLGADVTGVGDATVGLDVTTAASGEVTFAGPKSLAFGVELYELFVSGERLRMKPNDSAFKLRSAKLSSGPLFAPVLVGGQGGDVFLTFREE